MTTSVNLTHTKSSPSNEGEHARAPEGGQPFGPARYISPTVAHELNNILAIVQGYADRLLLKYANDASLTSELKLITEAARRAAIIVRNVTPQILTPPIQQTPRPQTETEPSMA